VLLLLLDDEEDENVADAIADKERAFRRAWCASIFFSFFFLFCEVCLRGKTEERKRSARDVGASPEQFYTILLIYMCDFYNTRARTMCYIYFQIQSANYIMLRKRHMNPVKRNGALKYCQNNKLATPPAAFSGSLEYIMVCKTMFEAVGVHPSMRKMSQKVWSVPFVDGKAELLIFLKRK